MYDNLFILFIVLELKIKGQLTPLLMFIYYQIEQNILDDSLKYFTVNKSLQDIEIGVNKYIRLSSALNIALKDLWQFSFNHNLLMRQQRLIVNFLVPILHLSFLFWVMPNETNFIKIFFDLFNREEHFLETLSIIIFTYS